MRYNAPMQSRISLLLLFSLAVLAILRPGSTVAQETPSFTHTIQPGDTWTALGLRYGQSPADLQAAYGHLNRQWQPPIGTRLALTATAERSSTLSRPFAPLLAHALTHNASPWQLALQNDLASPFQPTLFQPIAHHTGDAPPRDLPPGLTAVSLTPSPPQPGQALLLQAQGDGNAVTAVALGQLDWDMAATAQGLMALGSTGAFFKPGAPELQITTADGLGWSQPWPFEAGNWVFQQVTFTGAANPADDAIATERERLFGIWTQVTPQAQWQRPWIEPVSGYLEVSSDYGARRSVNGGPYSTYHEGVDFAAFGGTAVVAPAAGTVVLAEFLTVRGGSVIVDHGLGVYSGYYHLSAVEVEPGQTVQQGDKLGEVGTTGRSTGNHLHWDLVVNGRWVDAAAWLAQDMGCAIITQC